MSQIKRYKITEPYLDLNCSLAEAPFHDVSRNLLRFVDISKNKLHTVNLVEGPSSHKQIDLEHSIGTTADIEGNDDEFIFGGKYGYGIMKKYTGEYRWIKPMWSDAERQDDGGGKTGVSATKEERMRSNDGKPAWTISGVASLELSLACNRNAHGLSPCVRFSVHH